MQRQPTPCQSKGFSQGIRVRIIPGIDHKRAEPAGTIVAVRDIQGRPAYMVRHDCGRLRTWRSAQLGNEAQRPTRR
ncbi:MAG: hypothetical protein ACI9U2_002475 [Bradymonadia bacterium]|jgi:hypothetical protein